MVTSACSSRPLVNRAGKLIQSPSTGAHSSGIGLQRPSSTLLHNALDKPLRSHRAWRVHTLQTDSPKSLTPGTGKQRDADDAITTTARAAASSPIPASDIVGTISTRLPKVLEAAVPEDVLREFEHKLEADVQTVGVTLTAILGVIIFWRGVWSLLDHFLGDSIFGDISCAVVGLAIVLYIRLSGAKLASFWPPS